MKEKPGKNAGRDWSADLTTRSGYRLHVRLGTSTDLPQLTEMFANISARDLDFRFFPHNGEVDSEQVAALVDAGQGITTFIAFAPEGHAIACVTLFDGADHKSAAVSLSVRSDWKGRGVSWTLLDYVLGYAAAHGLQRVTSVESGDDNEAISLQREMGFVARLRSADPLQFSLTKAVDPA